MDHQGKDTHLSHLEEKLIAAPRTKEIVVTRQELMKRSLVSILKEKLSR